MTTVRLNATLSFFHAGAFLLMYTVCLLVTFSLHLKTFFGIQVAIECGSKANADPVQDPKHCNLFISVPLLPDSETFPKLANLV
jgi:hypothetical protein